MSTGWDNVAVWYDEYLKGDDTYQSQVILPNLLRVVDAQNGDRILDVASGQGYFARAFAQSGAQVVGIDASAELIDAAERASEGVKVAYKVGNAEKLDEVPGVYDAAVCVLAFENMKNIPAVLSGVATALKDGGRFVVVMLHPAFRIPQHSDWTYSKEHDVQSRKVGKYLSEVAIPIELNPFKNKQQGNKKVTTTTYHRPLQWYMKAFKKSGFVISGLEEWISHKKSQSGPRQHAEDVARKEFPMFLMVELKKLL